MNGFQLDRAKYMEKLLGCWYGKAIGGALGGPLEGSRTMNQITYYVQALDSLGTANDDLDLQLVWLLAAEEQGIYNLNERILGEYWLTHVLGPWGEYGGCKANLRMGLTPPLSGSCNNFMHNSNGAWIRSEIWASIFPGSPDEAARFAYYDACVDHKEDGIWGEVFTAALESLAYIKDDIQEIITLALNQIPENSRVTRAVNLARDCYAKKVDFAAAREAIVKDSEDIGWFQAPANIAFVILGLLYGEKDFGRSIALAVNCGDDTDCTGATAGALLGILYGKNGIDKKWIEPIGDKVQTCCIDTYGGNNFRALPKSFGELANRILELAENAHHENRVLAKFGDGDVFPSDYDKKIADNAATKENVWARSPYEFSYDLPFGIFCCDYENGPFVTPGKPIRLNIGIRNSHFIEKVASVKINLPDTWKAVDSDECLLNVRNNLIPRVTLTLIPGEFSGAIIYIPVTIKLCDRMVPYTLNLPFQKPNTADFIPRNILDTELRLHRKRSSTIAAQQNYYEV